MKTKAWTPYKPTSYRQEIRCRCGRRKPKNQTIGRGWFYRRREPGALVTLSRNESRCPDCATEEGITA